MDRAWDDGMGDALSINPYLSRTAPTVRDEFFCLLCCVLLHPSRNSSYIWCYPGPVSLGGMWAMAAASAGGLSFGMADGGGTAAVRTREAAEV